MYLEYKDEPEKRNVDAEGNLLPTMVGMIMIDLEDRISETNWQWDAVGPEALWLKTESKLKPPDHDEQDQKSNANDNAPLDGIAILADSSGGLSAGDKSVSSRKIANPMQGVPVSSPLQPVQKKRTSRRDTSGRRAGSTAGVMNPMFAGATDSDSDSDNDSFKVSVHAMLTSPRLARCHLPSLAHS